MSVDKKTQWQQLYTFLKSKGVNVYSPAQAIGECKTKYVVVKSSGATRHPSFSTDVETYSLLCYVPKDKYSELEGYVMGLKGLMKEIYPQFIATGQQTPSFYDDDIKAHMVSIDYKNYKKI